MSGGPQVLHEGFDPMPLEEARSLECELRLRVSEKWEFEIEPVEGSTDDENSAR